MALPHLISKIGIEYSSRSLNEALSIPNIVGLMFERKDEGAHDINLRPFTVRGIAWDESRRSFDQVHLSSSEPNRSRYWIASMPLRGGLMQRYSEIDSADLEYRNTYLQYFDLTLSYPDTLQFGFVVFFASELRALFSSTDGIIISGANIDFGTLSIPGSNIDGESSRTLNNIFTLKAESMDIYSPPADVSPSDSDVGFPVISNGVPCPPLWIDTRVVSETQRVDPTATFEEIGNAYSLLIKNAFFPT
ncbi:MAG: hypothetical protein GC192_21345 [Bacteroidetes bacterium]|nr:hypothetical protein [Bacteroidota bacterium]